MPGKDDADLQWKKWGVFGACQQVFTKHLNIGVPLVILRPKKASKGKDGMRLGNLG